MKITNQNNLPEALVHAVTNNKYDGGHGDISVTTLIAPPQQRHLTRENWDNVTEDASNRIWALLGSSVHHVLQLAAEELRDAGRNIICEERFYSVVDDKKVSAQIDLYENGILDDFKVTSVWAMKDAIANGKDEWTAQLNVQAYLMEMNGQAVDELYITAICRDWSKSVAMRDPDMPEKACRVPVTMWDFEATEDYIRQRLQAHYSPTVPECTPEECWDKPPTYALMKTGRKSAVKLEATRESLGIYAADKGLFDEVGKLKSGYSVQERAGSRPRCEDYCTAKPFCNQYKTYLKNQENK